MGPPGTTVTRRLAAILIADVVGYSRLMERDDTGTFARLRSIRDEVVDPAIVSHDGRIVKTAGDGFLAEFPSALAALRASVQIQREMAKRNEGVGAEDRLDYRIGINLGDVMADGSDIAGDGVNVAARLESIAEPGGICVSGSVREQVHGQMTVTFEDIGEQQVKNIARPIRAFHVTTEGNARRARSANVRTLRSRGARVLVAVLALAAGGWLLYPRMMAKDPWAPPMSVAVLPLAVTGEGLDGQVLSNRLTQDVISALTRGKRRARVPPYALVSDYKAGAVDPRSVGRAANVRYVAEGEIRIAKDGTTVVTRLYDAATAAQLATDTSNITDTDAGSRDQDVIARTASQVKAALAAAERARARDAPGNSSLDAIARSGAIMQEGNYSLESERAAEKLIAEALKRDPNNVALLVRHFWLLNNLFEDDLHTGRDLADEMDRASSRAVSLDQRDAEAWHARAIAFGWKGRFDEADAALARARQLDPDNPEYFEQRTHLMLISGKLEDVRSIVDQVVKRTGSYSDREWRDLCWVDLASGSHAAAIPSCAKAAALSDWWTDEMFLTAAYAQGGQLDEAK
jgi:class 3 adenylate cyclase/TolB-like protein